MMTDKIEIFEDEGEEFHLFEGLFKGDIFKDGKGDYYMCVESTCEFSERGWVWHFSVRKQK